MKTFNIKRIRPDNANYSRRDYLAFRGLLVTLQKAFIVLMAIITVLIIAGFIFIYNRWVNANLFSYMAVQPRVEVALYSHGH